MSENLPAVRNLPLLLLQGREIFMQHFRPILNHFGVTEQQWRIIRTLHENGKMEPREICEHCMIYSSSLAGILKRMEELGFITRHPVAEDKRRVLIHLNEKSEQLAREMTPIITQQYQYLSEAFGETSVDQLYTILDELIVRQDTKVKTVQLSKNPEK